ncbi:unnamed protein product [Orchesella dallaii]|uniref:Uncharacterized protein n=1 Tax=Orchesella dallaii TaxID=48710 RepID=A0ABP1RUM4_9HEXA
MTSTLWDTVNGNKTANIGMTSPASPRKTQTTLELHIQDGSFTKCEVTSCKLCEKLRSAAFEEDGRAPQPPFPDMPPPANGATFEHQPTAADGGCCSTEPVLKKLVFG